MSTALVIHGHFYQPPRENPWTGVINDQPSAYPHPNWNERVYYECYRPNAYARVVDLRSGRIEDIVNNYEHLNFNFGPTLLSWMETRHPGTYGRILDADRQSLKHNGGHGNAIAQAYNHAILPLCNDADRSTQVKWGVADFKYRFGRDPESMWLPETACDDATLSTLIEEGIRYVILSPIQAQRVRPLSGGDWTDVGDNRIDPGQAYRYFHRDGSKRSIDIFFYDMGIARGVAFEGSLISSQALLDRIGRAGRGEGRIVQAATDGESYGHHTKFGDRSLAYALKVEAERNDFWVTNYGAFLEKHPPAWEVEIKRGVDGNGTSWSCDHGVGRWWRDCGCHTGGREGWTQAWRGPLRRAFDFLRDRCAEGFEAERGKLFQDPWAARNEYIDLILHPGKAREPFLSKHAGRKLSPDEQVRALTYLEIQRHSMLMYTSCGWFFSEISGIETVQILSYAAHVFDLLESLGAEAPKSAFLDILAEARSNLPEYGSGADVYRRFAESGRVAPSGVAADLAVNALVNHLPEKGRSGGCLFTTSDVRKEKRGRLTLLTARITLRQAMTHRESDYAVAGLHLGGVDFYGSLRPYSDKKAYKRSAERLWEGFQSLSLPQLLRLMQEEFGPGDFGVEQILPENRQRLFGAVFGNLVNRFSEQYARLYEDDRRNLEMLQGLGFELPKEIRAAAEYTFGRLFEREIQRKEVFRNPEAYRELTALAEEVTRKGYQVDRFLAENTIRDLVTDIVRESTENPTDENLGSALAVVQLAQKLGLKDSLNVAQEILFRAASEDLDFSKFSDLSDLLELRTDLLLERNRKAKLSVARPSPSATA